MKGIEDKETHDVTTAIQPAGAAVGRLGFGRETRGLPGTWPNGRVAVLRYSLREKRLICAVSKDSDCMPH